MIISEKQIMQLIDAAKYFKSTLRELGNIGETNTRYLIGLTTLIDTIDRQQSEELKVIE